MATEPGDDVTGVDATERPRRRRLRSQLLSGPPADSPEAVVDHLLAVQVQDGRGFRLAVRRRSRGLTAGDVDAALDDGRLLVTWLNRGTLHLVRSEDYWWLHRLTAHRVLPGVERRLRQLGVAVDEEERGVRVIVEALESDGHHTFVSVERWLGSPPADPDRAEDLDRLVRRYLAGHAPAGPEDLAMWAGITLGDARLAFAGAAGDLRATDDGSLLGLRWPGTPAPGPPRLLGPFDPVLHGWVSREPFVGAHRSVVTSNGVFRAACLVGGRVVGTWTQPSKGVVIDLLEDVDASAREVLATEARDVARFFGRGGCPVTFTGRTGGPVG
jgi:hypothetical protein